MLTSGQHRCFNEKTKFQCGIRRESAQLAADQNSTVTDTAQAMNAGLSGLTRRVKQLRDEQAGKTPKVSSGTPVMAGKSVITILSFLFPDLKTNVLLDSLQ